MHRIEFPRFHESCRGYSRDGLSVRPGCTSGRFEAAEFRVANTPKELNASH